ncbi:hypothetical protein FRB91_000144 [Serendipita sp. 411]|nr:hypothetical protein FRB91_000144 [Serendipita sp. 411]
MTSIEPKPNPGTTENSTTLAVPNTNRDSTSELPSRAETLIERGSEETSENHGGAAKAQEKSLAATHTKTTEVPTIQDHQNTINHNDTVQAVGNKELIKEKGGAEEERTEAVEAKDTDEDRYITGFRLFLVFVGLLLSIFLVALDQTIIATALPVIASKFNSLSELTWVVSVYFFTQTGLVLTFGQLLTIVDSKLLYLFVIATFEIGSLFCAVAWNMPFLIFGRAIAGVGAAGIFISILTIISRVTRLEDRPILFGAFGAVFAVSSVAGPLMGGAFTDHLSWRWCFYINLPFGAVSILAVIVFLKSQPTIEIPGNEGKTKLQKWIGVDWVGTGLCLAMIMPLLLALQWGGNSRPWNDKVVIALFCVFGVVLPAFVYWELRLGSRAIMPMWLYKRKSQIGCSATSFFVMMNLIVGTYYLPFYYQASRGRTPTQSGIDILPFMLTIILSAAISGAIINFTGRYIYFLRYATLISAVGAGLLFTLDIHTSSAKLIGYQIIYGLGVGCALQNTVIAIQTEWADRDELIPQATSIVTFFQLMGGILGIAIAGSVFANQLRSSLAIYAPGLDPHIAEAIKNTLSVVSSLRPDQQAQVLMAYVKALNYVFIVSIPTSVLASLSAFLITDHNVKERGSKSGGMAMACNVLLLTLFVPHLEPDYTFQAKFMGVRGIARWSNAPPDGVKQIEESVSWQQRARKFGVWLAELRTLRRSVILPDGTSIGSERLLWEYISGPENILVIIEDPTAPKRAEYLVARAEIHAANAGKKEAGVPDSELQPEPMVPRHYRHTLISFRMPMFSSLLDQLAGPWNSQAPKPNPAAPSHKGTSGGMIHRLSIRGNMWNVGSDWIVRVGGVYAAGDIFRGVIMEIEYLPVDILPYVEGSSAFLDAFTLSLLPSLPTEANFNSVIIDDQEWAHVCGVDWMAPATATDDIYVYGEEESVENAQKDDWRRSAYMIVQAFHGEGLL